MAVVLVCRRDNDLCRVLRTNGIACQHQQTAAEAVDRAAAGTGVMLLADGYPERVTAVDPALFTAAVSKGVRLYVEYPAALPGLPVGMPRDTGWERVVVASDAFAPSLARHRILMLHGCRFVPVETRTPHLVMAWVAGFDSAVYGLPPELHGAWFRAFDYKRWDYWAGNADAGWDAWCLESGWTQAWILSVLALRRLRTSFWELTAATRLGDHLGTLLPVMFPDGTD